MDVPPMTPAAAGAAREFLPADAYEQYWDCLESDTPAGEDLFSSFRSAVV